MLSLALFSLRDTKPSSIRVPRRLFYLSRVPHSLELNTPTLYKAQCCSSSSKAKSKQSTLAEQTKYKKKLSFAERLSSHCNSAAQYFDGLSNKEKHIYLYTVCSEIAVIEKVAPTHSDVTWPWRRSAPKERPYTTQFSIVLRLYHCSSAFQRPGNGIRQKKFLVALFFVIKSGKRPSLHSKWQCRQCISGNSCKNKALFLWV